jgi:hypothetical protein
MAGRSFEIFVDLARQLLAEYLLAEYLSRNTGHYKKICEFAP